LTTLQVFKLYVLAMKVFYQLRLHCGAFNPITWYAADLCWISKKTLNFFSIRH